MKHIFQGTAAPAFAPGEIGDHYIDTMAKMAYISVGTASTADWLPSEAAGTLLLDQTVPQVFTAGTVSGTGLLSVAAGQLGIAIAGTDYIASLAGLNVSVLTNDAAYLTAGTLDISALTAGGVTSLDGHNISELTNDSAFITAAAIPTAVSSFTNDSGYLTTIAGLNVSALTNDAGYLTDISALAAGTVTSLAGHNVSELTNDSGFLTTAVQTEVDPVWAAWYNTYASASTFAADVAAIIGGAPLPFADNSSGANWATAAPTNTTDAINRLAAAVAGLLATPIP